MSPQLTLLVPTLNERPNIGPLLDAVEPLLADRSYEILFVDDASPDGTFEEIQAQAAQRDHVRGLLREAAPSLAGAVIDGVKEAHGDLIVVMDGDLQHDPSRITVLVDAVLDGADLAVASRFVPGGDTPGLGQLRLYLSVWGIWLVGALTGVPMADPFSGFFAVRREAFLRYTPKLSGQGFKILLDLATVWEGPLQIVELPAQLRPRHL